MSVTARFRCRSARRRREAVRVEAGALRHREHAAGARVEHDAVAPSRAIAHGRRAAPPRPAPGSCGRSSGRRPCPRAPALVRRRRSTRPNGSLTTVSRPARRASVLVELELEAREAAVVDAGVAEHLRGDRALRVGAPLLADRSRSPGRLPLQRGGLRRVGLARDVDEALRPVGEQRVERGLRRARACARSRDARPRAGSRPGAGWRRRSSPARRSRAGRRCGRRSCRGRRGSSTVSRCWVAPAATSDSAPHALQPGRAREQSPRTRAAKRRAGGGSGGWRAVHAASLAPASVEVGRSGRASAWTRPSCFGRQLLDPSERRRRSRAATSSAAFSARRFARSRPSCRASGSAAARRRSARRRPRAVRRRRDPEDAAREPRALALDDARARAAVRRRRPLAASGGGPGGHVRP